MNDPRLSLAFSPCPNDTFIFCALVNGLIKKSAFSIGQTFYEDVETLNIRALEATYDITKLSFHAFGHVRDRYTLLTTGSALGRGCGPILVKPGTSSITNFAGKKIAIPGRYTTAAMLLKLYLPEAQTVEMRFDQIMASVLRGEVDAGVIIHESRFTFQGYGLTQVIDLGTWWEHETGGPLPLGGIALLKTHSDEIRIKVTEAIGESILWAQKNQDKCAPYIKQYAQELDDTVIESHISLYVNKYSAQLGVEGKRAIDVFLKKGEEAGLFPSSAEKIL